MCEIIDEACFDQTFKNIQALKTCIKQSNQSYKTILQECFTSKKLIRKSLNQNCQSNVWSMIYQVEPNLDILIQTTFFMDQFNIKARFLSHHKFISVKQMQRKKILTKEMFKRSFYTQFEFVRFIFFVDTGLWQLQSAKYIISDYPKGSKFLNNLCEDLVQKATIMNKKIDETFSYKQLPADSIKYNKFRQILRYYHRCTIQPSISNKIEYSEFESLIKNDSTSILNLDELIQINMQAGNYSKAFFQSLKIYGFSCQTDFKTDFLGEVTINQKDLIQSQVRIPQYTLPRLKQNKYLYNQCYFYNNDYQSKKIFQGGNSLVYVIKPELYEITSAKDQQRVRIQKLKLQLYFSKHLVYKQSKQKENRNQENIVYLMRSGSCLFLSKYYLNIQKNSRYTQKLFMDYLPGSSLQQYIQDNSMTMSLFSKHYILVQILQGLRFVNQLGIVHLDVKELNVLVLKNIICKLIDFGESYHFAISQQHHKPKYTIPYGSPEAVTAGKRRSFTEKSDVFSLGILMHKIWFGRYPYFAFDHKKFMKMNYQNQLRSRTFFVPEENYNFGHPHIITIMNQLIYKCIDQDENKRPFLDWLTLIIKCSLNFLTTL